MSMTGRSYYWENRDELKERNRRHYHEMKERYQEKYKERRERCIAYMKAYNKIYYQQRRDEILEKNKAYGQDKRDLAMNKDRKRPKQKERKDKERAINKEAFVVVFDDDDA